jgi:tetratricopeptide (TPR) repeat protein
MTATRARPVNPYIAGRALHQRSGFFGRDDILRLVETDLRAPDRNVIVLFGQRRIGKTSILLQLEQALPNPPFVAVHFDLMDRARQPLGRVLHDIAATLADDLDIEIAGPEVFDDDGHYFRQQFLPELYRQLGPERRAVLLFDEFDVLDVAAEERLPDTAAARAFFLYLRQLMEEPQLGFVFVVDRRAEDLSIDVKATFKAARYKRVSVLSPADTQALIRLAEQQGSLQFATGTVERIMVLTAGHPYLTQLFCQILWDHAHADQPEATPTIDPAMVEATVPQVLEAGQHAFEWIWDGLPPAERVIFAAIAEATDEASLIAEDDLIELLQSRGIRILVRELELAPRTLVEWEMLRAVEGGYAFAVELLRRWVAQNKPLPRVKDELDRVVPFAETLYRGGEGWYRQRDLENAVNQLRQALTVNPNHLKARLLLGQVLIEQEQPDAAIAELEEAYQYDADAARYPLVRALLDKAQRLERDKQPEVAVEIYERVLNLSPRETIARTRYNAIWIGRGDTALQSGEFDTAIKAYEKARAQDKIDQATEIKRRQRYEQMVQTAQRHEEHEEWPQALTLYQQLTDKFPAETGGSI